MFRSFIPGLYRENILNVKKKKKKKKQSVVSRVGGLGKNGISTALHLKIF